LVDYHADRLAGDHTDDHGDHFRHYGGGGDVAAQIHTAHLRLGVADDALHQRSLIFTEDPTFLDESIVYRIRDLTNVGFLGLVAHPVPRFTWR